MAPLPNPAPLVSVVLPTYNGSRFIAASIESCLNQTYPHFELIVVDGGSTDDTLAIVARVADTRVRVMQQPSNSQRLPGALNLGFAHASGEFYTWTQDDDVYMPEAIEVLVGALVAQPEAGLAYAGMWFIDEKGKVIGAPNLGPPEHLYWTNSIGHCFLYRRSVAERVGAYDFEYLMAEDNQYWMRVFKQATITQVPGRYYCHRLHSGSLSMHEYGRYQALRVAARARRDILGINRSAYWRQVAAAYVEEAFAAYAENDYAHVRRCLARGLSRNPLWLRNRGVCSILLTSLARRRQARRVQLAAGSG
jgi:glycosyltransferase involved in cell wall biosynthesis